MSREQISYEDIIRDDYNNHVDSVTDNIKNKITTLSKQKSDIGNDLGHTICEQFRSSKGKSLCKLSAPSELNTIINSLPIYLIIAHSTVDINLQDGKSGIELNNSTPLFSTLNSTNNLAQAQFLINTTTPGAWGLLNEDIYCIPQDHLLQSTSLNIRNNLFRSDINCDDRIASFVAEEGEYGRTNEKLTTKYTGLFNIPGTKYFNKIHQFGGKKLSGGGFGIIKLSGISPDTAFKLLEVWKQTTGTEPSNFNDNIYFLSNSDLTSKDNTLYEKLRSAWNKKGPYTDGSYMWNTEMSTNDILKYGEPGIYISLSCSELFVEFPDGREPELENPNSPDHILLGKIYSVFKEFGSNNRTEWDNFMTTLGYISPISTRTTTHIPSASTLSRVNYEGPQGSYLAKEAADSIASRVKRVGGKRKTRRRKNKSSRKRKASRKKYKKRRKTRKNKKRRKFTRRK